MFVDADLTHWGAHFVTGLLGPLLTDERVQLVRAAYARLRTETDGTVTSDGGRLTELVARPLIGLHWPELAWVAQPLAGEWAARRSLMESLPVPVGYGVELSTLVDTVARHGLDAIAQVHLGVRGHRHRPDEDLALAATELLAVASARVGGARPESLWLHQFKVDEEGWSPPTARPVTVGERPPATSVPDYPAATRR